MGCAANGRPCMWSMQERWEDRKGRGGKGVWMTKSRTLAVCASNTDKLGGPYYNTV